MAGLSSVLCFALVAIASANVLKVRHRQWGANAMSLALHGRHTANFKTQHEHSMQQRQQMSQEALQRMRQSELQQANIRHLRAMQMRSDSQANSGRNALADRSRLIRQFKKRFHDVEYREAKNLGIERAENLEKLRESHHHKFHDPVVEAYQARHRKLIAPGRGATRALYDLNLLKEQKAEEAVTRLHLQRTMREHEQWLATRDAREAVDVQKLHRTRHLLMTEEEEEAKLHERQNYRAHLEW